MINTLTKVRVTTAAQLYSIKLFFIALTPRESQTSKLLGRKKFYYFIHSGVPLIVAKILKSNHECLMLLNSLIKGKTFHLNLHTLLFSTQKTSLSLKTDKKKFFVQIQFKLFS